jgi:hypothetical protein
MPSSVFFICLGEISLSLDADVSSSDLSARRRLAFLRHPRQRDLSTLTAIRPASAQSRRASQSRQAIR